MGAAARARAAAAMVLPQEDMAVTRAAAHRPAAVARARAEAAMAAAARAAARAAATAAATAMAASAAARAAAAAMAASAAARAAAVSAAAARAAAGAKEPVCADDAGDACAVCADDAGDACAVCAHDRKRGGGWARGTLRQHCPRLTWSPRSLWSARAVAHHAGCPGWLVQAPSMAVAVAAMAGRVASADVAALRAPRQQGGSLRRLPRP
jgi:hypothetical protein